MLLALIIGNSVQGIGSLIFTIRKKQLGPLFIYFLVSVNLIYSIDWVNKFRGSAPQSINAENDIKSSMAINKPKCDSPNQIQPDLDNCGRYVNNYD